jgi:hypothetical protein
MQNKNLKGQGRESTRAWPLLSLIVYHRAQTNLC